MVRQFQVGDLWQDRIGRVHEVVKVRNGGMVDARDIRENKVYQFDGEGRWRRDKARDRRDLITFVLHLPHWAQKAKTPVVPETGKNACRPTPPAHFLDTVSNRKAYPIATGCFDYFPEALAAVSNASLVANEQHNPGERLHWAKEKSTDHADCMLRHFTQRGTVDKDGVPHSAKVAWRALAMLQIEMESKD